MTQEERQQLIEARKALSAALQLGVARSPDNMRGLRGCTPEVQMLISEAYDLVSRTLRPRPGAAG